MSQLSYKDHDSETIANNSKSNEAFVKWRWYILLPLFAFTIDTFSGQLIVWGALPSSVRWLGDAAIAAMIVIVVMRMLFMDRIPIVVLLVLAASLFGIVVALFEGQSLTATAFGWWRLFMYPLVGLYAYLMPAWPPKSANWLLQFPLVLLVLETVFQTLQFLSGQDPSDHLAGTFGRFGVGPLSIFLFLVIAFGFGQWLSNGNLRYLAIALACGAVSSTLGEIKLFPAAVLGMAVSVVLIQVLKGRHIRRVVTFLLLVSLALIVFIKLFDMIFTDLRGIRFQDYLETARLNDYLTGYRKVSLGQYALSRNTAPIYYWQKNQEDIVSLLFGQGIGSSGQSDALGLTGVARENSFYQAAGQRSLEVFIRESGAVGLVMVASFLVAVSITLFRRAGLHPESDLAAVQYGLILFSIMWPLWFWYYPTWFMGAPMLLYWTSLGFALNPVNAEN